MDLESFTTEELISLFKRRSVPQEALDLLRDNDIDGSTLLLLRDDVDEFKAVVPKSAHRLIIKRIMKEELSKEDLEGQPTTPPDKLFKNKHIEFVLVCIGNVKEVDQVFVCGEDHAFFESDRDLLKALVDLISAYYVFDVKYPQSISGILYFLQEIVLLQSSEYKGTKFATFMAEFKKRTFK